LICGTHNILIEIKDAVSHWHEIALGLGLVRIEMENMAAAFRH